MPPVFEQSLFLFKPKVPCTLRGLTTEIDKEKGLRAHRRQWRRRRRRVTGRKGEKNLAEATFLSFLPLLQRQEEARHR